MHTSQITFRVVFGFLVASTGAGLALLHAAPSLAQEPNPPVRGTATTLADGRVLWVGGSDPRVDGVVVDSRSCEVTPVGGRSVGGRTGHTATLLPDGSVLVFGGRDHQGHLAGAERFIPAASAFMRADHTALEPRTQHTATLLTDGRVVIAGGLRADGTEELDVAWWDVASGSVETIPNLLTESLTNHQAALTSDGSVWLTPATTNGSTPQGVRIHADTQMVEFPAAAPIDPDGMAIEASIPSDGEEGVAIATRIAIRFSQPALRVGTIRVEGDHGKVETDALLAEGGRLLWIAPATVLRAGRTYNVTVSDVISVHGRVLAEAALRFRTDAIEKPPDRAASQQLNAGDGSESARALQSRWRSLPPLQAPAGQTALAGQALRLNGQPLSDVTIELATQSTRTDGTGRFLLTGLEPGRHEFVIDGSTAGSPGSTYGVFEVGVSLQAGRTTALSYTIWMTEIDTQHSVTIPGRTPGELVITSPRVPGLELRLPANSTVKDRHGNVVTEISITQIPLDRPPFPLPADLEVPIYFTVQPGGAYVEVHDYGGPKGARLFYPNLTGYPEGKRMAFWHYDPDDRGWYVYGSGRVMPGRRQIVPDPGVTVYEFTGAMVADPSFAPDTAPVPRPELPQVKEPAPPPVSGDPVDLGTGLFVLRERDLFIQDVLPIELTRTYRQNDSRSRPFGVGTTHEYEIFLVGATNPWTSAELVLPDGGRVSYTRTSPGSSFVDAVFEHTSSPSRFQKSRIAWNGGGWDLRLRDGTVYVFPDGESVTTPARAALVGIRDRNGNVVRLRRDGLGRLLEIVSPHGRWIRLQHDALHRIIRADDNAGRYTLYTYDSIGRLTDVRNTGAGITTYTYDDAHRMRTVRDPRNSVFLTNEYDGSGRVSRQTMGDGGIYLFTYTIGPDGNLAQTDVTDPRSVVRRVTFNNRGYRLSDTQALGQPEQRVTTWVLDPITNLPISITDALNRQTTYTYNGAGKVLTETRLAGTPQAVTTTYTYEPTFNQIATITDPLNHTWSFAYDALGRLTSITDPLSQQQTMAHDAAGRMLTVTDPLLQATGFSYVGADLVQVITPAGATTTFSHDGLGRTTTMTDALGRRSALTHDDSDRPLTSTDAIGSVTTLAYDPNGNLLSLTDARSQATTFSYDILDRQQTRTDPLMHTETTVRDLLGNVIRRTDRKGQVSTFAYDALNRQTFAGFGTVGTPPDATYASTVTTTHDAGNRVLTQTDSLSGAITRMYDGLDRLVTETTPQGVVTYTYDAAGRRTSFTVAGQPTVNYTYDNANRLLTIQQGATTVSHTYDAANRRTSVTLPNGIVTETGYDAASRVTSLTYRLGVTVLGDLTYTYNAAGDRVAMGGSFASTGLPSALTGAAYDAGNRGTSFGGTPLTHDLNGNLIADGSMTYTWDARDRLVGLSGPGMSGSFAYDAQGRRISKTVNGTATAFAYDGANPVQELSGTTPTANLLTGLGIDEYLARDTGSGPRSYLADALGSTVALTTPSGAVDTSYTYEPFGRTTLSGTSTTNAMTFTGREDDGTGLLYLRARFYSPTLQRFVSEDPAGFVDGPQLYAYVGNAPTSFTDPFGLEKKKEEHCDGWFREPGHDPTLGRETSRLVWPDSLHGRFFEYWVPGAHAAATTHDALVGWLKGSLGLPDWAANIPTMRDTYTAEFINQIARSLGHPLWSTCHQ